MRTTRVLFLLCSSLGFFSLAAQVTLANPLYELPGNAETQWFSFENPQGKKGAGGSENKSAKGHAFDQLKAGQTLNLLDVKGAGIINRIWLTLNERSPYMLRALRINMYWDDAKTPAVSAPLGDFFGLGLGKRVPFENEFFSDPEGRSFNSFIPMPFKTAAKITLTNDSNKDVDLLYYDINLTRLSEAKKEALYFHAWWHRELETQLGKDYELLPALKGAGRFLGVNVGVLTNKIYEQSWWGEGEVKIYLDGDKELASLVGTGTEDYIGSAWGQGVYNHRFQGSLIADENTGEFAFYRYHIPDPVFFSQDIRVTLQQLGGWDKSKVLKLLEKNVPLIPVSIKVYTGGFIKLLEQPEQLISDRKLTEGWVNFYRQDDVSATAYFYLNRPENNLAPLAPLELRTKKMALQ